MNLMWIGITVFLAQSAAERALDAAPPQTPAESIPTAPPQLPPSPPPSPVPSTRPESSVAAPDSPVTKLDPAVAAPELRDPTLPNADVRDTARASEVESSATPTSSAKSTGLSASRPDWADRVFWSNPPLRFRVVRGELYATPERALQACVDQAVPIAQELLAILDEQFRAPVSAAPTLIHQHLVKEEFVERVAKEYGPMYRAYLLLEVSPAKRDLLQREWHSAVVRRKLTVVSGGFAFLVTCIATMLGYLRLDDATRGYYSGRLRVGAAGVMAGAGAALYFALV